MVACTAPNPAFDRRLADGSAAADLSGQSDRIGPADGLGDLAPLSDRIATPPPDGPPADLPADGEPTGTPDTATPDLATMPEAMPPRPDAQPPDMTPAEPVELTRGLLGHWSFNEGSGTRADDGTSGNNDGTLRNGANFVASTVPGAGANSFAARFGGGDDHMTISIQTLPRLDANKTISLWVLPVDRTHTALRTIVAMSTSNDSAGIQLGTDQGRPAMWRWGASTGLIRVATAPAVGWYHLAYTWDGARHRLYFNGTLVGNAPGVESGPVERALLGCYDTALLGEEMFVGQIDELRIYDRVVNASELARLARGE